MSKCKDLNEKFNALTDVKKQLQGGRSLLLERFHVKDSLVQFAYEELIDTVYSNEKVRDAKAVERVFKDVLALKVAEAKSDLKANMKEILKELKG